MSTSSPAAHAQAEEDSSTETSQIEIEKPFVGRWNQLVSTTNWEKGRIIHEWRDAMIAAGASAADYADEAWSLRVGGVTSQHVGRLRRVFQRFGKTHDRYPRLFWSHFQASIDWDDAEMWLEGAVQNSWPVADMRRTRGETLGAISTDQPDEVVAVEVDEDCDDSVGSPHGIDDRRAHFDDGPPAAEGPDFGDADEVTDGSRGHAAGIDSEDDRVVSAEPFRPFENLRELPADLADAFDAFKVAILRHKADDWQQISRDDVVGSLDALKELAKSE